MPAGGRPVQGVARAPPPLADPGEDVPVQGFRSLGRQRHGTAGEGVPLVGFGVLDGDVGAPVGPWDGRDGQLPGDDTGLVGHRPAGARHDIVHEPPRACRFVRVHEPQVSSISPSLSFSAAVTDSSYVAFTETQERA